MTQEEKELLLKDLCARLPYVIIVHTWYNKPLDIKCTGIDLYTNTVNLDIPDDDNAKVYIDNCKPYLRPLSSMTEEEKETYPMFFNEDGLLNTSLDTYLEWLLEGHFDFKGLIPRGLALEAPEGMYNIPFHGKNR